jgi:hypothetical protein
MLGINVLAVIVAAVVAFVMGGLWYSSVLFGKAWMTLRGMDRAGVSRPTMRPGEILAEFGRGLLVAVVLARFIVLLGRAIHGSSTPSIPVTRSRRHSSWRLSSVFGASY